MRLSAVEKERAAKAGSVSEMAESRFSDSFNVLVEGEVAIKDDSKVAAVKTRVHSRGSSSSDSCLILGLIPGSLGSPYQLYIFRLP